MKKNNKRLYWILGIALALLVIVSIAFGGKRGNDDQVETEEAAKRKIVEFVSATGKIQPEVVIKISPEVSGKITRIHVKEGEQVKEGDKLLTLNPDILEATLNRTNAALNTSRANLSNSKARLAQVESQFIIAQKSFDRNKKLHEDGVISEAEYESALSAYEVATAELEASKEMVNASIYNVRSAEATRKEASDNLMRTVLFAPDDGIITALNVEEGETVLGTVQMAGTEVMRVSKLDTMEVDVEVNESDIVRVSLHDTAFVEVDAYLDRKFKGLVTEIANAASSSGMNVDQVTNFSVKIRILPSSYEDLLAEQPNAHSPFRSGMSATVEIQTAYEDDALSIPIESVTTRTDTASKSSRSKDDFDKKMDRLKKNKEDSEEAEPIECVFLYRDGKAKLVPVKTGIQDSKYIQILEGIAEDDEVIIGPYSMVSRKLENGDRVSAEERDGEEEENEDDDS